MKNLSDMNFTKSFDRARAIIKVCLFSAMGLCILGLIANKSMPDAAVICVIGAIVLMLAGVALVLLCLKCPYCGRQIFVKCLTVTVCPHCHRNLSTGMKGKKGRRK